MRGFKLGLSVAFAVSAFTPPLRAQCDFEGSHNVGTAVTGSPMPITVQSGFVFQSASSAGLFVIDVRDPNSPSAVARLTEFELGYIGATRFRPQGLTVLGDFVYLVGSVISANGQSGLGLGVCIVDISVPAAPVRLVSRQVFPAGVGGSTIEVVGDRILVGTNTGLHSVALEAFLTAPVELPLAYRTDLAINVGGIALDDQAKIAYLSGAAVYALDVSDPSNYSLVSTTTASHPGRLAAAPNRLYAVHSGGQLRAWDTSNPSSLVPIWNWYGGTFTNLTDVAVLGSLIIATDNDRSARARIFQLDGRSTATLFGAVCAGIGCTSLLGGGSFVAAEGQTVCIASGAWQDGTWQGVSVTTIHSCLPTCVGDANGDGFISFVDVNEILSHWLGPGPDGDADDNGIVDFSDINAVLANWLGTCE